MTGRKKFATQGALIVVLVAGVSTLFIFGHRQQPTFEPQPSGTPTADTLSVGPSPSWIPGPWVVVRVKRAVGAAGEPQYSAVCEPAHEYKIDGGDPGRRPGGGTPSWWEVHIPDPLLAVEMAPGDACPLPLAPESSR